MNKSIYIAVLNQGWIRPELSRILTRLTHQNKYNLTIKYPSFKPIEHNRNKMVKDFLENTTAEFLLFIDGDNVPPINVLDLADYQKDIIGGLCFGWKHNTVIPLILELNTKENIEKGEDKYRVMEVPEDKGLVECDGVGTGLMMIKRDVLEEIKYPFENYYDEDGIKTTGLDLNFCEKAKKKGFKVYCHTDFQVAHWNNRNLQLMYNTYNKLNENKKHK